MTARPSKPTPRTHAGLEAVEDGTATPLGLQAVDDSAATPHAPVRPVTLVDRIRQDIVDGFYHPRERLVEAELAEHYGAKRSSLRSALIELTAEGLIEREPNRGARVRGLTVAEGIEIVQVRRELESLCARLAAERASGEERRQLRKLSDELHSAYSKQDLPRYLDANVQFHRAVIEMARHRLAQDILTRLGNLNLSRHFPIAFQSIPGALSEAEHEHIAASIISGDADQAAAAMSAHLQIMINVLEAQARAEQGSPAAMRRAAIDRSWSTAT